jgi:hypothetical protein
VHLYHSLSPSYQQQADKASLVRQTLELKLRYM